MLFNSVFFITWFLPLALLGWYLLQRLENPGFAKAFLTGMSFWFYGYYNANYLWILLCSLVFNYGVSALMRRDGTGKTGGSEKAGTGKLRKLLLAAGISGNLGLLFYFKYFNFFIDNCNFIFHTDIRIEKIALPLGISFFTFQQLSFVVERYRGNAPHYSALDYSFFISFFPQLVAGPIVLHSELVPQLAERKNRKISPGFFYDGLTLFILGLAKKVLLADALAVLVNSEFENIHALDSPSAWLVICWFTMELYFDFSGYSDMAKGLGKMFNIELPVNFNSPYKACSVKELWQRWHMTLSRFFVQYVYIPLGGSRKGKLRTILNTFLVFFLSGLWHGANWTYVAWGTMQGLLVIWDNLGIVGVKGSDGNTSFKIYIPRWLGWIFTFGFFNLSLYFFRSESMADAFQMFRNIFTFKNTGYIYKVAAKLDIPEFYLMKQIINLTRPNLLQYAFLALFIVLLLVSALILTRKNAVWIAENHPLNSKLSFFVTIIFVWSVISFSQVSTFIYFNF